MTSLSELLTVREKPETADEREQLDACLAEASGNGRLALQILLRRIDALTEHHATIGRIRQRIVGAVD